MAISRLSDASIQDGLPKFDNLWDGFSAVGSMDPISAVTLSSTSTSTEFNNIPSTYSHLQIRGIARSADASSGGNLATYIRINADSGSNYSFHQFAGNGSTAITSAGTSQTLIYVHHAGPRSGDLANTFSALIIDFVDYANTNKFKTLKAFTGHNMNETTAQRVSINSGMWMSTSAITSIQIFQEGSLAASSSFSLYGIK